MAEKHSGIDRRTLLCGGLTATAVSALGLGTSGAAYAASATQPRIHSTAEWGARPPAGRIVVLNHRPTYIVVHHTAGANSTNYSLAHAKRVARSIQNHHMNTNGWVDSGQQFTNSRGGHVLEGRHKSLNVVRVGIQHVQGANVGGYNSKVIGIENEGHYSSRNVTAALWDSLVDLVAWIADRYDRPVSSIRGHRDFNSTACPGDVLYRRLQELRNAVARRLGVAPVGPLETWPLLRPGDTGPQVSAAQHLLRARGFTGVPTHGTFDGETRRAVATLARVHGVEQHTCTATYHTAADETGFLGADLWPLLTPAIRAGENGEVSDAVSILRGAGADPTAATGTLTDLSWKRLLA